MVLRYQSGVIGDAGDVPKGEHDMGPYHDAIAAFEFNRAIDEIWVTVRALNQYLEHVKPWEIAKKRDTDPEAAEHLSEVLVHSTSTLLQIADQLVPFMPTTAEAIHRLFDSGVVPADAQPIFPKIYLHTQDPRAPKVT